MQDECPAKPGVGRHQTIFDPQPPTETDRSGLIRQKRIGTDIDKIATDSFGPHQPPRSRTRFEECHLDRFATGCGEFLQAKSGGEAG